MTSPRQRSRRAASPATHRPPLWTAFVVLMMLASMFSTLVDPAFAQGDGEQEQEQPAQAVDTDGDGITDEEEAVHGTNPNAVDSDGDGFSDYDEVFLYGSNPNNPDTDGDGIPDGQDSDPTVPEQPQDSDGDGLTDEQEAQLGTDPTTSHSDGDGVTDFDEVNVHGTDPTSNDTDGDGIMDPDELFETNTDPNNPDSDGDGVNDGDEIAAGTDPLTADTADEPGTIGVTTYFCAPDALPSSATEAETANCGEGGPPVTYTLNSGASVTGLPGATAFFNDLPPATDYTIAGSVEPPSPGYAVFCEGDITNTRPYAFASASSGTPSATVMGLQSGENVECDWFWSTVPTVDITHTKFVCPEGYDPGTKPAEQLQIDCTEPVVDVSFTVRYGQQEQTKPVDDNNFASFSGVSEGEVESWETVPAGYTLIGIWCSLPTPGIDTPMPFTKQAPGTDGHLVLPLVEGRANCLWFNQAPQYDYNYLVLYKHECAPTVHDGAPANASPEDSKAYYDAECPTAEGRDFDVEYPDGSRVLTRTGEDGKAVWEGIPTGTWTATEFLDEGYGEPFVYCRYTEWPDNVVNGEWVRLDAPGGVFSNSFQYDDMGMECHVYNLAPDIGAQQNVGDPSNLTIHKWICPAGYDYAAPNADPMTDCSTMAPDGITFTVTDADPNTSDIQSDTGDQSPGNGFVYFGGLPPGMHTITEEQDPAYASAFLWNCTGYQNLVAQPINTGWSYDMDVPSGMEIDCHWMNVPAADGDGFSVTLYKWLCPAGTMTNQSDPSYYNTECSTQHPGIPFTLDHGGPQKAFASDTNGEQVDNILPDANGQFTITELIPPGFGSPVGYCQPLNGPDGTPTLLVNGVLTVTVPQNFDDDYQCWYYNIPTDAGFSVTLYKWECPAGTMYNNPDPTYYSGQCATEQAGVPFSLTDANGTRNFNSDTNGHQEDNVVPTALGQFILMEGQLDGFGDPVGFCQPLNGPDGVPMTLANGMLTVQVPPNFDDDYHCWYYNIPEDPGMVTIYKWDCPEGMEIEQTSDAHKSTCTSPLDQVTFTLTDSMGPRDDTTANGVAEWNDVRIETVTVAEHIPLGYNPQPYVSCRDADQNAMPLSYSVYNGVLTVTLTTNGQHVICDWYNQFQGPGELTVYKWRCPEGYDRTAWNADPATECTEPYNGVTFTLDQPQDIDLQTDTGDSIDGAVYFGGLMPGDYVLTEMVPDGIVDVFVLDCVGMDISSVHPIPLSVGPSLSITVGAGDQIRCDWFNVPGHDPAYGWLMLTKYQCSTPTYISDIDCLLYAGGQEFDLQAWNGSTWTTVQGGTTNGAGQLTFAQLDPGTYRLSEPGKTACLVKSDRIENGQVAVVANGGTTVKVYNCGSTPTTPKTPTKYPDTGTGPGEDLRTMDGLSLLGLLGTGAVISRRRLLGAAALGAGTIAAGRTLAAQDVVPLDAVATPSASPMATPGVGVDCLFPATPAATPAGVLPGTPVACARGAVPVRIRIPAIEVDAPIEYLEFIEGTMEQPTGETNVAWYKNSARLGEQGNGLYAGHLNWWGVPQAVFFRLAQLPEGEAIEIEGDNGETYRFLVQWKQDFPSDEEPPEEALGHTPEQAITVITCGGEWNAGRAEYDHRTLVRAVRDIEAVPSTPVT